MEFRGLLYYSEQDFADIGPYYEYELISLSSKMFL